MQKHDLVNYLTYLLTEVGGLDYTNDEMTRAFNLLGDEALERIKELAEGADIGNEVLTSLITNIGTAIEDMRTFNHVEKLWLNDGTWQGGVDKNGGIVLWDKITPKEKITMNFLRG